MKVLVIGSGGREHAIIKKIKESSLIPIIYALPGNFGMKEDAILVNIKTDDFPNILKFAKEEIIDFAIVGPDNPLADGLVDLLENEGIKCFGPTKKAAMIESSKVFAKNLMKKYGIPTAKYEVFSNSCDALTYIETCPIPTVIKCDGLALGKGVVVAQSREDGKKAILEFMENKKFGESGSKLVIEEFLEGTEVSVLTFTDGNTICPMVSSMDHKRAFDDDLGPNTGGMGAISPNPFYTDEISKICMEKIFIPTIKAMNKENRTFKGCLYFGLMITKDGPKVIEYNSRFGDPETQCVLPLLDDDLLKIMIDVSNGNLNNSKVTFKNKCSCSVVMASIGYPGKYEKGFKITIPNNFDSTIYYAGVAENDGNMVTSGGRVLCVNSVKDTLYEAIKSAYEDVKKIDSKKLFYRTDIGKKALNKN